jgi:DNA-3-methyladenine glycosylase
MNVVTEEEGFPAAVLIRALDPLHGLERMRSRRGEGVPLCAGPGRLAQALGIDGRLDGHRLERDPLLLLEGWGIQEANVGVSGRIGIREATEWPLRFFVRGHPELSR